MYTSKLFKHLEIIRKEEWKPLRHFLVGSINERSDAFRLFDYIYSNRKNLSSENLEINLVNERLFPQLARKSFQNILSVLVRKIEEYWIWSDLQEDHVRKELHRLEALNKRGLYTESDKSLARIIKMCDNNSHLDLWNDYYKSRARFEIYFSNNPWKDDEEKVQKILSSSIRSFSSFLGNMLLNYKAELHNRILAKGESWGKTIDIIERLDLSPESTRLNESLESQVSLLKFDYTSFPQTLNDLIRDDSVKISELLSLTYFYHIRRYHILQVRSGKREWISDLLELIKWSLDSGMLKYHDELEIGYFISDISILCALNEIDEAKVYMQKHLKNLNLRERKEGELLGSMMIYFVEKKYDLVIDSYVVVVFKKVSRRLQAAGMFLRAAYELYGDNLSFFDHHLRNVSDFIRRNQKNMTVQQVRSWKNFIYMLKLMIKGTERKKLVKHLSDSKDIIHRKWLDEKIKGEVVK